MTRRQRLVPVTRTHLATKYNYEDDMLGLSKQENPNDLTNIVFLSSLTNKESKGHAHDSERGKGFCDRPKDHD